MFRTGHTRHRSLPGWLRLGLVATAVAGVLAIALEAAGLFNLVGWLGEGPVLAVGALAALGGACAGCAIVDHAAGPPAGRAERSDPARAPLAPQRTGPDIPEPASAESAERTFQGRIAAELATDRRYVRDR